jgi:hypothetical protein
MRAIAYLVVVLVLGVVSILRWAKSRRAMREVLAEDDAVVRCRLTSPAGEALFRAMGTLVTELEDAVKIAARTHELHPEVDEHYARVAYRQSLAAELRKHLEALSESDRAEVERQNLWRGNLRALSQQAEAEDRETLVRARAGLASAYRVLGEPEADASVGVYR